MLIAAIISDNVNTFLKTERLLIECHTVLRNWRTGASQTSRTTGTNIPYSGKYTLM